MCEEKENRKKEYREFLIVSYKENVSFLDKSVFGISILIIPYLIKNAVFLDQGYLPYSLYIVILVIFTIIVLLHLLSSKIATRGCDKSLSDDNSIREEGIKLFKQAKVTDSIRDFLFVLAILIGCCLFAIT